MTSTVATLYAVSWFAAALLLACTCIIVSTVLSVLFAVLVEYAVFLVRCVFGCARSRSAPSLVTPSSLPVMASKTYTLLEFIEGIHDPGKKAALLQVYRNITHLQYWMFTAPQEYPEDKEAFYARQVDFNLRAAGIADTLEASAFKKRAMEKLKEAL